MTNLVKIVPLLIYLMIGSISMMMAMKIFLSRKFLPFQEEAYGKEWESIDKRLQDLILALMRLSGLGFLIVSFLLLIFPVYSWFNPDPFSKYAIPLIALVFCTGLFIINFILYRKTNASTPWKKSLYGIGAIIIGMAVSYM